MHTTTRNRFVTVVAFGLAAFLLFLATACEKEGPAEKAGKEMDKAMDSAKKSFNELTKK